MADMHRSAMGRNVDMAQLRARNEHIRAVGNMNVNARGDIIDSNGNVISDNAKRVNEYYMQNALNRGVRPGSTGPRNTAGVPLTAEQMTQPARQPAVPKPGQKLLADPTPTVELTPEELAFEAEDSLLEMPIKQEQEQSKSNSSKKH